MTVAFILAFAAAAGSQPQTGTNVPGQETAAPVRHVGAAPTRKRLTAEDVERNQAREVMQKFAACIVKAPKRRPEAAAVVLDDVPNAEIIRRHSKLINGDCLPFQAATVSMRLTLPGDYLRYALAEALVLAEVPHPFTDFEPVPPLQHRNHDPSMFLPEPGKKQTKRYLEWLERNRAEDQVEVFASKFGECVVRMDPLNTYRLLSTKPASDEEMTVFSVLHPALGSCLAPGQTIKATRSMLRGAVAVNYFRLERASRPPIAQAARQ